MNFRNIEKCAALFKRIQEFDAAIIQLEAIAQALADGTNGVRVTLAVEKENSQSSDCSIEVPLLSVTDMFHSIYGNSFTVQLGAAQEKKPITHSEWISEGNALRIVQALLDDKLEKREILKKKLSKIWQADAHSR
jgi:hypothetical protein